MDDTQFVEQVLHKGLGIKHVVVGQDYGFGKNRCGDVESLTRLCAERSIGVTALEPIGLHKLYGKYGRNTASPIQVTVQLLAGRRRG